MLQLHKPAMAASPIPMAAPGAASGPAMATNAQAAALQERERLQAERERLQAVREAQLLYMRVVFHSSSRS